MNTYMSRPLTELEDRTLCKLRDMLVGYCERTNKDYSVECVKFVCSLEQHLKKH